MKKLKPLFGFECSSDDDGLVSVEIDCDYPQESNNCLKFYKRLEELKIIESNISFPLRLVHWTVTINATDEFTIKNYFGIRGIKKIVDENKSKLIGKKTFVKAELQYPKKAKYPNLHIHFYQLSENEGMHIFQIECMVESCLIHYGNLKQFTSKRLSDLERFVNTAELKIMAFLPMELVKFDNDGNIEDFQHHLLSLKAVELPF